MSDVLVTVRLPRGMLEELSRACAEDHFLDQSEAVRSILRSGWLSSSDPYVYEIKRLREEITSGIKEKSHKIAEKMVADEFRKIRQGLKDED